MYGCGRHIECVSVTAYEIGAIPKTSVECLDSPIFVSVNPVNDRIKVSCSVVCSINMTPFVMVNPTYIWLTPEMLASGEFDITSNTSWIIN
jgi:hypothetical protein